MRLRVGVDGAERCCVFARNVFNGLACDHSASVRANWLVSFVSHYVDACVFCSHRRISIERWDILGRIGDQIG